MKSSKYKKIIMRVGAIIGTAISGLFIWKKWSEMKRKNDADLKEDAYSGAGIPVREVKRTVYEKYMKRVIDIVLSIVGIIVLSPVFIITAVAIFITDPGPVIFTQKRVGINKTFFKLYKFRSMKMSTPHDVPTHMLDNPESYITSVGRFIRKTSIDELPQLFNILEGNLSIIGPRPALWNQEDLIAERDKYCANDVMPGLTGWAQINGRDELEIPVKAKLDGEYVEKLRKNSISGIAMDVKCFFGTITSVLKSDGVVEGGTGELKKSVRYNYEDVDTPIGFEEDVTVDFSQKKKILITGANSYIGESFENYAKEHYNANFEIDTVDMIDGSWRDKSFFGYDTVFHVAGIAHADVGNVSEEVKDRYYAVNTDLAIETAEKAKKEGVKQFVFMSSMIVYGDSAPYGKQKIITADTKPEPANFYGDSKWQADKGVRRLANDNFHVLVVRPPMIYGKGSKGNYPTLAKLAKKLPVFPNVNNQRSMLYIENLCEFLCQVMLVGKGGIFFPQNAEYTQTADMVRIISEVAGKRIWITKLLNPCVWIGSKMPGKIGRLVNKAFGNSCYDLKLSKYDDLNYQHIDLKEGIVNTEIMAKKKGMAANHYKKNILVVTQYFYPETFRINDMCQEWVKRGYAVTVVTGIPNYPEGKIFEGYGLFKKRNEVWNGIDIIRIPLIPRGNSAIGMIVNYLSFMISGFIVGKTKKVTANLVFSFEVSPMTQVLTGISFAKRMNVPHYLYVQDLWPENVVTVTGIRNPFIIKPIDKMVDYIYRNSDEIFATSPSFVDAICNRKEVVPREKVHYWPQYAEEYYRPLEKKSIPEIENDDSFKIVFTGNVGMAQGLQILPETAELLNDVNIKFVIVGDGRYLSQFEKDIKARGVDNKFIMIPRQPSERIPEILAACDVAFLSFQDNPLWSMTIPAKLQSYMACGMPIIASAKGETARIIEEAQCGICSSIGDAQELRTNIINIMECDLKAMGQNSRNYFDKHFSKKRLMDEMDEYFVNLH